MYPSPKTKIIQLTQGKSCIVDADRYNALMKFKWRAVQANHLWYAKAWFMKPSGRVTICMHRFIARTKFPDVCHHINGNSLDNRKANLKNQSKNIHRLYHQNNKILTQFENYM